MKKLILSLLLISTIFSQHIVKLKKVDLNQYLKGKAEIVEADKTIRLKTSSGMKFLNINNVEEVSEKNGTIIWTFEEYNNRIIKEAFEALCEANKNKNICYYILPTQANIETDYFIFMYRLMKTVGTKFLNESERLSIQVEPFSSFEDIILHKNKIRKRNSGNNSSYITKSSNNTIQVFGKLYGANKYETSLLCLALYYTSNLDIELFEIEEGNLKKLPQSARDYLLSLDRFKIINATITMEETEFQTNDSLRSPRYIYNLLERLGDKKCAFCNCDIPQLIDGAHILPVAEIKDDSNLNLDEKLKKAIDGNNGIWLCKNHHKLLDSNILKINRDGTLKIKSDLDETSRDYIDNITSINQLSEEILTSKFIEYIGKRNEHIQCSQYNILA